MFDSLSKNYLGISCKPGAISAMAVSLCRNLRLFKAFLHLADRGQPQISPLYSLDQVPKSRNPLPIWALTMSDGQI